MIPLCLGLIGCFSLILTIILWPIAPSSPINVFLAFFFPATLAFVNEKIRRMLFFFYYFRLSGSQSTFRRFGCQKAAVMQQRWRIKHELRNKVAEVKVNWSNELMRY